MVGGHGGSAQEQGGTVRATAASAVTAAAAAATTGGVAAGAAADVAFTHVCSGGRPWRVCSGARRGCESGSAARCCWRRHRRRYSWWCRCQRRRRHCCQSWLWTVAALVLVCACVVRQRPGGRALVRLRLVCTSSEAMSWVIAAVVMAAAHHVLYVVCVQSAYIGGALPIKRACVLCSKMALRWTCHT